MLPCKLRLIVFIIIKLFVVDNYGREIRQRYRNSNELFKRPNNGYSGFYRGNMAGYPSLPRRKWSNSLKVYPEAWKHGPISNRITNTNYMTQLRRPSPNDVLSGSMWSEGMEWDFPLDPNICHTLRGMTWSQTRLCNKYPETVSAAAIGLKLAVKECQKQLRNHKWNCTSLAIYEENPHLAPIMEKGYSETAFVHAITSAGVTHSIARACAAGKLTSCSCGNVKGKRAWKWSGCHDNTKFGARFSRMFLDIREINKDVVSYTHLYNNEVGRKVVRRNREVHCKCHGMSGSCEIRTCWKAVPKFHSVGKMLVKKLQDSQASHFVFGNAAHRPRDFKHIRRKISVDSPLLYAEPSPTFCNVNNKLGVLGTLGRVCNRTSAGADSCEALCCSRGYNIVKQKIISKCKCTFKWCCQVTCKDCVKEEWIAVCK